MRSIGMLIAAASFVIATGLTTTAQATTYYIRLDNSASGATLAWAKTTDTVSVFVVDAGDGTQTPRLVQSKVLNSISDTNDFTPVSGSQADIQYYNISKIIVSINGHNMFWLDQIELIRSAPVSVYWDSGVDNADGRCFSTISTDYIGYETWCAPDSAEQEHTYIL